MAYDSYLVRIWWLNPEARDAAQWRATVTRVHDGDHQTFSRPEVLLEFLTGPHRGRSTPRASEVMADD